MAKKSFQDSMDWDDIMFDKQPNATGTASEWDNFSVPNFTTDTAQNSTKPQTTNGSKESLNNKTSSQRESRKGSKKSSTRSCTDRTPDNPTDDDDDKSRTVRKQSSTTKKSSSTNSKSKNCSPRREERRQHTLKRNDSDSDDDEDDNYTVTTKSTRASGANSKEPIRRSSSVSRRKERKNVPVDKDDESKQSSSKLKRDKRTGDNESKLEPRKSSDESSVRRRDKSPTNRGERSRVPKDDDTAYDKDQKKPKAKKEKSRKPDDHDDEKTLGQSSHRRDVSTRRSRSTTIDDKLDDQSHSTRDSSRVRRSRNGQLNAEQLSQSRQRAVQRMEARNNWRESQRKSISTSSTTPETPVEDDPIDTRRASLLDQSRRGPIRSFRCNYDDDDDDDDFSVLSGMTSSSFTVDDTLDAPFVAKNIKSSVSAVTHPGGSGTRGGGGYLPNSLNNTNTNDNGTFHKKERRPSAFGTGYERAMALNSLKNELDNDSDEEGSSYALPTGLSRSAGTHFEIDRSGRGGASARRPSLSTTLTVPCINGIDDSDNDDDLYSKSSDRRGSLSSKEFDLSSKDERRGSMTSRNVDYESDSNNKKASANYDSTVEDMLKSRRLRGARGDAAKKKEETKSVKKTRGLSISMLTNLVQSASKSTPETSATGSATHRRASTAL